MDPISLMGLRDYAHGYFSWLECDCLDVVFGRSLLILRQLVHRLQRKPDDGRLKVSPPTQDPAAQVSIIIYS
jgi:hypothetical protein